MKQKKKSGYYATAKNILLYFTRENRLRMSLRNHSSGMIHFHTSTSKVFYLNYFPSMNMDSEYTIRFCYSLKELKNLKRLRESNKGIKYFHEYTSWCTDRLTCTCMPIIHIYFNLWQKQNSLLKVQIVFLEDLEMAKSSSK